MKKVISVIIIILLIAIAIVTYELFKNEDNHKIKKNYKIHLWVSNQSSDDLLVNITVKVDGTIVFEKECDVGDQHNWLSVEFNVTPGNHLFEAFEYDKNTELSRIFDIQNETWICIWYMYYIENDKPISQLQTSISDKPVVFK